MTRDFKLFRGLFLLKIVKSNCIVVLLFFAIYESSRSADIKCQFGDTGGFAVVGMAYLCTFYNANISSEESAKINKVTGGHENLKTHDDVLGFYSTGNQVINYFPQGLDKFFINIKTIALYNSNLKEIHQADLKPFPKLIYLNLYANDLEILEEGLLDFNPDLKVVGFQQNKLFHIDSNVFDGLKKLSYLWLDHVPCISKNAMTSIEVQASIATIKDKCTSSEFTSLDVKITNLENKSKTLSPDLLRVELNIFENTFNNSKFLIFRPLNYKLENLKIIANNKVPSVNALTTENSNVETCTYCFKADCSVNDLETIKIQLEDSLSTIKPALTEIETNLNENQVKISEMKTAQSDLIVKTEKAQSYMEDSFIDLSSKIDNLESIQNELKMSKNYLNNSLNYVINKLSSIDTSQLEVKSSIIEIKGTQITLKSSQDQITNSLDNLNSKFNRRKISHDKMTASISDIEVTLSDLKISQNEILTSFLKLKTMQSEVKLAINDIRSNKAANSEEKDLNCNERLESQIASFEAKAFEKIEKKMSNTRHKMSINFDEKIYGIEKRLMKKFEDTLEDKLGKILEEKLERILGSLLKNQKD